MHTFRASLDRPNLPTIPVISPQCSPSKNLYSSPSLTRKKQIRDATYPPRIATSSDYTPLRNKNSSLIFSFDETSNKGAFESDNSIQVSPTSPFYFNSERFSRSLTLSDNSSTEIATEESVNIKARTSVARTRKRARFYKNTRGSCLFPPPSPLGDKVVSNSSTTTNSKHEGKGGEEEEDDDIFEDEKYIEKVIIVQSLMRRFLVYNRIRRQEKMRIKERQKLEDELSEKYNQEIERIKNEIQQHLPCKEYDETVDLFNQYVNDIEKQEICTDDQEEKLKYLFYICSEDTTTNTKSLNLNEFLVLTNEILNLSTPDYSYVLLFPEPSSRVEFIPFLLWYKTSKEKGVTHNNFLTSKIKSIFKQKSVYPYLNHIKILLHSKIVSSVLNNYDKLNKPLFQCPICNLTTMLPKDLSKHIVQCRYDRMLSKSDSEFQY